MDFLPSDFAVVIIGRNEGSRLEKCIASIRSHARHVVYVDSGSTDNSVALSRSMGCEVVNLDMQIAFTAARARNEGFTRAMQLAPNTVFVQFVDGDCEMAPGWMRAAIAFLQAHPDAAAACGRLRERHPEASIYNRLCDLEWDTPVGEAKACGGIVMMRAKAFSAVQGFRPGLIAGEEPELCVRLRAAGWRIWRLGHEMALHDAAMTHFGQWWKRTKRAGYAFAAGAALHGAPPERHYLQQRNRGLAWGIALPLVIAATVLWAPMAILLVLAYPLQVARLALKSEQAAPIAWLRAAFLVLGRFPEGLGSLKYFIDTSLGKRGGLIEYK